MKNIIFSLKHTGASNENDFLPINKDYTFANNYYPFGLLSKTNIFIGENNSGKSRFLRHLFATRFYSISKEGMDNFLKSIKWHIPSDPYHVFSSYLEELNYIYKQIGCEKSQYSNVENNFFKILKSAAVIIDDIDKYYFPILRGFKDYKNIINSKLKSFLDSTGSIQNKDSIHHFISLLNLEIKGLSNFDIYREIIVQEYFRDQRLPTDSILTGGKLYQEIKSMLLGDRNKRNLIDEFQTFLYEKFFKESGKVQLIPNEDEKILYVRIGDEERPIYNWGDGIQQLIIILFSLFVHKDENNQLFFIEEPELYLHPGILRKFIEVINSDIFSNHQYFITTHSNTVLDTSADSNIDMSIFKFKKIKDNSSDIARFLIEQCNYGDISLLNELGIRNSSVFLSNCSIWVEGITDRLYLKHFLNLYSIKDPKQTSFRENIDYTFIEYGGGNLVHFNFESQDSAESINAKYINNKIFLIADNDGNSPTSKKGRRKSRLKEILGDNFFELPVLEIENLITQETLKAVLIKQNPDKREIINLKFSKKKDFRSQKLGNFIDKLFGKELHEYTGESGAIKNKLDFCNAVIEVTTDYDNLSEEAKQLTEKLYNFIKTNNI